MSGPFPDYAFVPGGPWPHPNRVRGEVAEEPPGEGRLARGLALFDAGYYWEAHEVWEAAWHRAGRHGPEADFYKGLIKLAAAGVKVREGQPHGVVTHARRAGEAFGRARDAGGWPGVRFDALIAIAEGLAGSPPIDPAPTGARVSRVFEFDLSAAVTDGSG